MNPRLKALLIVVSGVAVVGASYVVSLPGPNVTPSDLADAGLNECASATVRATVRTDQATLSDAGEVTDPEDMRPRYREFLVPAKLCDEDLVLEGLPSGMEIFRVEILSDAGTVTGLLASPGQCACRSVDAGDCRVKLSDGGLALPIHDTELYPGQWQGDDCIRKSCGEIAGDQGLSMPPECK